MDSEAIAFARIRPGLEFLDVQPTAAADAPVSMPVRWEELGPVDPAQFTLRSVLSAIRSQDARRSATGAAEPTTEHP